MLRITEHNDSPNTTRLRLDGRVDGETYGELEASWTGGRKPNTLVLDMSGVVYMSDDAARRLANLRGESLRIVNCSPFIELLLQKNGGAVGER